MRTAFAMVYAAMIILLTVFVVIAHRTNKRNIVKIVSFYLMKI